MPTEPRTQNHRLAAVIAETGCTYDALAREIRTVAAEAGVDLHTARSAVHAWVSGTVPNRVTAAYIAEALSRKAKRTVTRAEIGLGCEASGEELAADPLAAAADLGRLVMLHRRDFLAAAFATAAVGLPLTYDHQAVAATLRAASSGGRAGTVEVTTVRQLTAAFRAADENLGGGHGLSTATTYLTETVVPMLRATYPSATVRQDAFGAAAELACLVGWKHHDLGREGFAQQYYLLAYQFALESGSVGRSAWMMRALTHQALDLQHPLACVELAEAAVQRARGKVDQKTEALLLVTSARAYSACGRPKQAAAALRLAQDALVATDDAVPIYSAASGPVASTVASHTAKTLTQMHEHRAAELHYRTALEGRTPDSYQRVHGLTLINLARSVSAQKRYEEAVSLFNRSLNCMTGVASARNHKELGRICSTMAVWGRRGIPGAVELGHRAAVLART